MERKDDILLQNPLGRMNSYLESHGLRKTPEREEVLKAVCSIGAIFSVDEVTSYMLHHNYISVSRVTVFNTLELLEKAGLLFRHSISRCIRYEYTPSNKPLCYLICDHCGQMTSYGRTDVHKYIGGIHSRQFTIKQPVLYLHGLCKRCEKSIKRKERETKKNKL